MPSRGQILPLAVVGALAGLGTIVCGLLLLSVLPTAVGWSLPFLAAYVSGLFTCRAAPGNLAARRLLLFGTTAVVWLMASDVLVLVVDAYGVDSWFAVANACLTYSALTGLVEYRDIDLRSVIKRNLIDRLAARCESY